MATINPDAPCGLLDTVRCAHERTVDRFVPA